MNLKRIISVLLFCLSYSLTLFGSNPLNCDNRIIALEEDADNDGVVDEATDNVYIPLLDDRGTLMGVANKTGFIIEKLYYNSTGLVKSYIWDGSNFVEAVDTNGNNIGRSLFIRSGWTGLYHEPFTQKYHALFRDYDPQHQRWLSEDPAGVVDGMNLYHAYMNVNYIDPKGNFVFLPFLAYALILTAVDSIIGTSVDAYEGKELTTSGQLKRVGKSFVLNSLTAGFASYAQAAKWGTKAVYGSSILFDTSVGTAYDTAIEGQKFNTALGVNLFGSVLGNSIALGTTKVFGKGGYYRNWKAAKLKEKRLARHIGNSKRVDIDNELVDVYRGINVGHFNYGDAVQGIATPSNINAKQTPFGHSMGSNNSQYTSWTTKERVAKHFAELAIDDPLDQGMGIILHKKVMRSQLTNGAGIFPEEFEVLIEGIVKDADIKWIGFK